jgi:hypothetical protein
MKSRGATTDDVMRLVQEKCILKRINFADRGAYGTVVNKSAVTNLGASLYTSPGTKASPLLKRAQDALATGRKSKKSRRALLNDNSAGGIIHEAGSPHGTSVTFIEVVADLERSRADTAAAEGRKLAERKEENEAVKKTVLDWLLDGGTGTHPAGLRVRHAKNWLKEELAVAAARKDTVRQELLDAQLKLTLKDGFWVQFKAAVQQSMNSIAGEADAGAAAENEVPQN